MTSFNTVYYKDYLKKEEYFVRVQKELTKMAWIEYTKMASSKGIDPSEEDIIITKTYKDCIYCDIVGPQNEYVRGLKITPHLHECVVEFCESKNPNRKKD